MDPESVYLVVYCTKHKYGRLIDLQTLEDSYDTEGHLETIATELQICKRGILKLTPCTCTLHGVIRIKDGVLTLDRMYGLPHEQTYPKGWKLKYYTNDVSSKSVNYAVLTEYFHKKY